MSAGSFGGGGSVQLAIIRLRHAGDVAAGKRVVSLAVAAEKRVVMSLSRIDDLRAEEDAKYWGMV